MTTEIALITLTGVFITTVGAVTVGLFSHVNDLVGRLGARVTELDNRVEMLETALDKERETRRGAEDALQDEEQYTDILKEHIWNELPPPPPDRPKK